ncbi:MAG TPA: low molecular weight protein-tyrosine-phosphatase [Jatrophihabitantaceae bacterium]|nr:low molecular weight protein-tyrosine-phosphatase [Jatrophihabitantaceae bacterium]
MRVCFVCSGNICRSPTAEAVFVSMLSAAGISGVEVDSAGTGDWHAGDDMDRRARAALVAHGYRPPRHMAKQFTVADFASRDLIVALDRGHEARLTHIAELADDPEAAREKVVLLRSYDPSADEPDVPDPYYDGPDGFIEVLRQIERACAGLRDRLAQQACSPPL